ncbi:uncharacterized protein LOC143262655 [Megalopta genalis]|uniref:uncharacterized protein LOC143262655 n=1 Tax=Megalopta genalis TaxID=115081 RepID=UPI003FD420EC
MECSRTNTESCIEWGSIEGGEIEFESLTEDTLEGALQVIRKSFFPNESICKAVNLISAPCSVRALEELCVEIAKDGVSIVAVDVKTGEVVGVVLNKIKILRDHPMPRDPVTNPRRPCGRPPFRRHRPVLWRPCQKSWLERFKDNCKVRFAFIHVLTTTLENSLSTKMGTGYITMTVSSINRVTAARENRNAVRIRSITSFNRPMIA